METIKNQKITNNKMKISVIGTGIYSTALSLNIARNNHEITMWSESQDLVTNFNKQHSLKPITDKTIPQNTNVTNDILEAIKDADLILLGTTSKYLRNICLNIASNYNKNIPICIASKGIENDTCSFLSDIVKEILDSKYIAVISGPTFAIDLINEEPCALSLSVNNKEAEKIVRCALENPLLKIRSNNDLIGTEICGSIKNVFAIASGILEGLGYHESSKYFLITECLHDIKNLLINLNCNPKTCLSYAGIGDLMLTCSSPKSRNYSLGVIIGQKKNKAEIEQYLRENTTEGYYTLFSIQKLINTKNIKMPIIDVIYDIVINNKNPQLLVDFLINKS